MSATELQHAVEIRRIFHIQVDGVRAYPSFFLYRTLDRTALEERSALLGDITGGRKFRFFTTARGSLANPGAVVNGVLIEDGSPRTPLQTLRDGGISQVIRAASAYARS